MLVFSGRLAFSCQVFNPFSTNFPFLYPLKALENWSFSDIFRDYGYGTLVENGPMQIIMPVRDQVNENHLGNGRN